MPTEKTSITVSLRNLHGLRSKRDTRPPTMRFSRAFHSFGRRRKTLKMRKTFQNGGDWDYFVIYLDLLATTSFITEEEHKSTKMRQILRLFFCFIQFFATTSCRDVEWRTSRIPPRIVNEFYNTNRTRRNGNKATKTWTKLSRYNKLLIKNFSRDWKNSFICSKCKTGWQLRWLDDSAGHQLLSEFLVINFFSKRVCTT